MAETTIENQICQICGADVRPQSLFCYSCGKSVAPAVVQDLPARTTVSDVRSRQTIVEREENGAGQLKQNIVRETIENPISEPLTVEEPKLKSAATMRRKPKFLQPKQIEIIWEEHENAPNGWFILAAVLLTLFAAGILYLAMFVK